MRFVIDYEKIFKKYDGIMRTCELTKEGITYKQIQSLIEKGAVEKIKYGYKRYGSVSTNQIKEAGKRK